MKKYIICEKIGDVLFCLGVMIVLLGMSIDLESDDRAFLMMLAMLAIGIGVGALGSLLISLDAVEATVIGALVVLGAFIYRAFRKPRKVLRCCYQIKKESCTYRYAYRDCKDAYMDYVDSLFEDDSDCYNQPEPKQSKQVVYMEDYYEQVK